MRSERLAAPWSRCGPAIACLLACLLACAPPPRVPETDPPTPLQLLFIGSSHLAWHDAPTACQELAAAAGHHIHVGRVLKPGHFLDQLAADPDVLSAIAARPWDYVVLQGAGATMAYPDDHHLIMPRLGYHPIEPSLARLAQKIRERGAVPVYQQPWAFGDGLTWIPGHEDEDRAAMQAAIDRNTERVAQRLDLVVAPVGPAWSHVAAERPDLPLHAEDQTHPSVLGSYLMACVICRTVLGNLPLDLPYRGGVPEHTARYLQGVAATACPGRPPAPAAAPPRPAMPGTASPS